MTTTTISASRLVTAIILFIAGTMMFGRIKNSGYADCRTLPHIIDAHLMPDSSTKTWETYSKRFFDSAYVREAAKSYKPRRYISTYYILDFFYPIIYCFLFLTLVSGFKGSGFYRVFSIVIIACGIFDLSENTSFAYFLFHQSGNANSFVAFFTTVKSILFSICILVSIPGFLIWAIKRSQMPGKHWSKWFTS
jgi:hypothetical protein